MERALYSVKRALCSTKRALYSTKKSPTFYEMGPIFCVCVFYMGWLRLLGSLKSQVSLAKEPFKRDYILQKRPMILRSLLTVATPQHQEVHDDHVSDNCSSMSRNSCMWLYGKSLIFYKQSPIFYEKSPMIYKKGPIFCLSVFYSTKRSMTTMSWVIAARCRVIHVCDTMYEMEFVEFKWWWTSFNAYKYIWGGYGQ